MKNTPAESKVRIDKWLWAARFYKTRGLAIDAINGGKIHLNNNRVKPSRNLSIGDMICVSKGPYKTTIEVLGITDKRGPAPVARALYQETAESEALKEATQAQLKLENSMTHDYQGKGRPTKRDRRHIIRFVNKND